MEQPEQAEQPGQAAASPAVEAELVGERGPFDHDRFLMRQKRLALSEKYYIYDEGNRPLFFVHREAHHLKSILGFLAGLVTLFVVAGVGIGLAIYIDGVQSMSSSTRGVLAATAGIGGVVLGVAACIVVYVAIMPKRHITFFRDDTRAQEQLKIYQDRKLQFINATYTVADPDLNLLGWLRKNYLYDFFRKQWMIHDESGTLVGVVKEASLWMAILRRILRFTDIPFLRINFVILEPDGRTKRGMFNRQFTFFDSYVLDLTADPQRTLDRRLAAALAVLLDTGERR